MSRAKTGCIGSSINFTSLGRFDGPEPKLLKGEDVLSEVDVLSQFAFLYKEQLLASLDALISEEVDDAAALTHEVWQQGESEILDDLISCSGRPKFSLLA